MATPNPPKPPVVATPPVSTPFSNNNYVQQPQFSPHGPKSVGPSPQQFKKSPANSATMLGYGGGSYDKPTPLGMSYDSPSAIAMGAMDMDLNMEGLVGMGLNGMGGLGGSITGTLGGRGDEEERKRKMGLVLDILKTNRGRLSEAGILRLATSLKLDTFQDWKGSSRTVRELAISNHTLLIDIELEKDIVKRVKLQYTNAPAVVTKHEKSASQCLLQDLSLTEGESPLTKTLNKFAANLERLSVVDALSQPKMGFNCHEAIAGIMEGLERVHSWEKQTIREQEDIMGSDVEALDMRVLCEKSGKPAMNLRAKLGMSLDYWQEKRLIPKKKGSSTKKPKTYKTWSLMIEVAPAPTNFPVNVTGHGLVSGPPTIPVRVSDKWISENIMKAKDPMSMDIDNFLDEGPVLDWLEPAPTLLTSADSGIAGGMDGLGSMDKLPDAIFVAKFDPPLVIPYGLALTLHSSSGAPIDLFDMKTRLTFPGIWLPHIPDDENEPRLTAKQDTSVPVFAENGHLSSRVHANNLLVEQKEWARVLAELAFSHPSQIVAVLPILRQYTFLSTIIAKITKSVDDKTLRLVSRKEKLAAFTSQSPAAPVSAPTNLDISFQIVSSQNQYVPTINVIWYLPSKTHAANITFQILRNGAVEVVSENILKLQKTEGRALTVADLGRMLEVTEDIGIWVEFLTRRLA